MSINLKTHKILWTKSGNRCAFPDCRRELVMDELETDDPSVIGEEAHIIAQKENGPRGNSNMPIEKRNTYSNLILLCSVHHKMIDDKPDHYSIEYLREIKEKHENWVSTNLNFDYDKYEQELICIDYITKWEENMRIDAWLMWSTRLIFTIS